MTLRDEYAEVALQCVVELQRALEILEAEIVLRGEAARTVAGMHAIVELLDVTIPKLVVMTDG